MIVIDGIEQRSEEWHAIRRGIPTTSNFAKIATRKGEPSKSATEYMEKLAAETITGRSDSFYISKDMQEGIDREPEAKDLYELITGFELKDVTFIYKDKRKLFGCSPDGITKDRGLEMKNPKGNTQIAYLRGNILPAAYYHQVQGSMLITGFKEWDFFSYHPGLPPFLITVKRDEQFIKAFEPALEKFCSDLKSLIAEIKRLE